jgi:hypothetical protein
MRMKTIAEPRHFGLRATAVHGHAIFAGSNRDKNVPDTQALY